MKLIQIIRLADKYRKPEDKGSKVVGKMEVIPQIELERIGFQARMSSVSGKQPSPEHKARAPWLVQILMSGVVFSKYGDLSDTEISSGKWFSTGISVGKGLGNWYAKKPTFQSEVKLMCSCPNQRHRYSWQLDYHKALVGGKIPYKRVTPPKRRGGFPGVNTDGGRPFVNPEEHVGFCHHIMAALTAIIKSGKLEIK